MNTEHTALVARLESISELTKTQGAAALIRRTADTIRALAGEVERYKAGLIEQRSYSAELFAERDEWARKWHAVRAELAELKYPGMKGEVKAI